MEWTETWDRTVSAVVPAEATHLGLIVFDNKGQIRGRIGDEAARNAARRRWDKDLGDKDHRRYHYQYDGGGIWAVMLLN